MNELELKIYLLLALAVITQQVTAQIARHVPRFTAHVAAGVGLVVAILTGTGLIATLGLPVTIRWPWVDEVLAGLLFAGGAAVVNSLSRFLGRPIIIPDGDQTNPNGRRIESG